MAHFNLKVNSSKPLRLDSARGKVALRRVAHKIQNILSGADKANDWSLASDEGSVFCRRAAAVCKMATGSGSVGLIINGTTVTVTWGTSDTASQTALVAAINANTTVRTLGVKATNYVAVLTLSSLASAAVINICGYRFTAGTDFSVSGTDNQDAAAFAVAINATPGLCEKLVAVPDASAGVLYLALIESQAATGGEVVLIETASSGLTVTSQFAAAAYSAVYAVLPGAIANGCTVTATGTNTTAHSAVSGKLGGGIGGASNSPLITSDFL